LIWFYILAPLDASGDNRVELPPTAPDEQAAGTNSAKRRPAVETLELFIALLSQAVCLRP